jgi:hypothetical protein
LAISGHGLLRLSVERFRHGCKAAAVSCLNPNSLDLTGIASEFTFADDHDAERASDSGVLE